MAKRGWVRQRGVGKGEGGMPSPREKLGQRDVGVEFLQDTGSAETHRTMS